MFCRKRSSQVRHSERNPMMTSFFVANLLFTSHAKTSVAGTLATAWSLFTKPFNKTDASTLEFGSSSFYVLVCFVDVLCCSASMKWCRNPGLSTRSVSP